MTDKERAMREQRLRAAMYSRYNVCNDTDLPVAFLRRMPRRPFATQLAARRIRWIRIVSIKEHDTIEDELPEEEQVKWIACLEPTPSIGGFGIGLLAGRSILEMMHSVGHEIGHTFFINMSHHRLERFAQSRSRLVIDFEEDACDTFGNLWVDRFEQTRSVLAAGLTLLRNNPGRPWFVMP